MTSAFAATLGLAPAAAPAGSGVQAGGARADAASSTDATAPAGGFDRMLQAQSRAQTQPRPAASSKPGNAPDAARSSAAPAESADSEPVSQDAVAETTADANDADMDTAADANSGENLPAQLLALLNGLVPTQAASPADAATPTEPVTAALPAAANATANPMPARATLPVAIHAPTPAPIAAAAAPVDQNADGVLAASTMTATVAIKAESPTVADGFELSSDTTAEPAPLALPTATPALTTRPVVAPSATSPLQTPVDLRADFDDGVGSRIVWMAEQRLGQAEIRVTPEHLGPIDVRLQLDGQRVSAEFLSAQPEVRHALEASLPRLRELLGQQGLQLAQADVGQRQPQPHSTPLPQSSGSDATESPADARWSPRPAVRISRGLLDEYA